MAESGLAIVGVTHFNKGNGGPAIGRGMGSLAWVAAARMAWGVVKSADDPTVRLMLPIKANLAADATGLSYKIDVTSTACRVSRGQPIDHHHRRRCSCGGKRKRRATHQVPRSKGLAGRSIG